MSDAIRVSGPISGTDRTLSFEAGKLAQLADGAVVARIGDTVVLATATAARTVREGTDFFPLTVDVEERAYAAGKIPGAFFRREGKPSDQAILICRLTDRPLRPSFPKGFRNETQVVATVFAADQVNPHDVLTINAASAALMISPIPFDGPIGAVRVALHDRRHLEPAPHLRRRATASTFELVVAGRALGEDRDAEIAIMMVEAGGTEGSFEKFADGAPKVTEEVLAQGLEAAKTWIRESINLQRDLVAAFEAQRGPIVTFEYEVAGRLRRRRLRARRGGRRRVARHGERRRRQGGPRRGRRRGDQGRSSQQLAVEFPERTGELKPAVRSLTKKVVRRRIVEDGVRIDGRTTEEIRPLTAEVDLFPGVHGSALFQRGETQVVNVATLGMPRMNQLLDTIGPDHDQALPAPLQLPAVLDGRDRPRRRAQAPRDRPRHARRARARARAAVPGGLPLHAAARL